MKLSFVGKRLADFPCPHSREDPAITNVRQQFSNPATHQTRRFKHFQALELQRFACFLRSLILPLSGCCLFGRFNPGQASCSVPHSRGKPASDAFLSNPSMAQLMHCRILSTCQCSSLTSATELSYSVQADSVWNLGVGNTRRGINMPNHHSITLEITLHTQHNTEMKRILLAVLPARYLVAKLNLAREHTPPAL